MISLFDYCSIIYGPCLTNRIEQCIQRVQKSCLRYSFCARKFDNITPLFLRSGWLNMRQRWILHICYLTFKLLSFRSPSYLYSIFRTNSSYHSSNAPSTRSQSLLSIPSHRTSKFQALFSYLSSCSYNSLPSEIRSLPSISLFKRAAAPYIRMHHA